MGSKERRKREKLELKELILKTAINQLEENGYENLTIRSIAKEIEYSPRTIYLYFKNKDELLYDLSITAFTMFREKFESTLSIKDPFKRLEELNKVYLKFAFENPGFYDLMFILKAPMNSDYNRDGWNIGLRSHQILESVVQDCIDKGHFKNINPQVLAFTIWSAIHGVVSLKIRDRMKMYTEDNIDLLINHSSELLHNMLKRL